MMTVKPEISILTPVWNGLPYLRECIESVMVQDFQNWELIISDNGSTDGSRAYLEQLNDPRIRVFMQDVNLGIMGNMNFLFKQATAPLSQILCADDYFVEFSSLSVILDYWKSAPQDLGFVRFNHTEPTDCPTVNLETELTPSVLPPEKAALWFFVFGNIPGNLSNVSLRTSLVEEVGGFDLRFPFAGDFEFWSRAARKVAMGVEKTMVVCVRRHEKVASSYLSLKGQLYSQHLTIYEKLIDTLSARYNRKELIHYFNFEVCSFHYRMGIQSAMHGKFAYLKRFIKTNSPIIWPKWLLLTACFPLAIFQKARMNMTVKMTQNLIKQNEKEKKSVNLYYTKRIPA